MVVLILGYGLHNSEYLILIFNPIPTGLGHVTLIYGLIPPMKILRNTPGSLQKSALICFHPLTMIFTMGSFLTFLVTIFKNIRSNFFSAIFKTTTLKLNRQCTLSEKLSIWSAIKTNFFNIK